VPVPEIYVLEQESGINAFAAGLNHSNAAITVTRGALDRLDRAELQGVIAHEFSHVLNGDMRLNQQLIGLSFGILVLSLMGRWLLRSVRFTRRDKNSGATVALAIGLALVVIGAIGVLCSRLIKAAVSRQRESARGRVRRAVHARHAGTRGRAQEDRGLRRPHHDRRDGGSRAHAVRARLERVQRLVRDAPPLLERIRALDLRSMCATCRSRGPAPVVAGRALGADPWRRLGARGRHGRRAARARGESEAPEIGGALRSSLPEEVYHAARARDESLLLVLALALAPDEASRQRQLALVENQLGATRTAQCRRLFEDLQSVDLRLRLPVLELALPALKRRPAEQIRYLLDLLGRVNALDSEQRLFDFVLLRVLAAYMRAQPGAAQAGARRADGHEVARRDAVRNLLTNVPRSATRTRPPLCRVRHRRQRSRLARRPSAVVRPPTSARDLAKLDAALLELAALRPNDKQKLLRSVLAPFAPTARSRSRSRALSRDRGRAGLPASARLLDLSVRTFELRRSDSTGRFRRVAEPRGFVKMRASHPIESTMLPAKIASLSVVALLTCAALGVAHCAAADSADEDKLVRAAEVLHEFTADEEKSIPLDLLQRARGVAVIPTLIRAASSSAAGAGAAC